MKNAETAFELGWKKVAVVLCASMLLIGCEGEAIEPTQSAMPEPRPTATPKADQAVTHNEVVALIRAVSRMTPPKRVAAYQRLSKKGRPGLDEVFLLALNETDPDIIESALPYLAQYKPPEAIDPLIDIMIFVQGDVSLRGKVADVLGSFGEAALMPILKRVEREKPERLSGGGLAGFARAVDGILSLDEGLNLKAFLSKATRNDIRLVAPFAARAGAKPLTVDGETIDLILNRVRGEFARKLPSRENITVLMDLLKTIGQSKVLPPEVRQAPPLILEAFAFSEGLSAAYAAVVLGDGRLDGLMQKHITAGGSRGYWALLTLSNHSSPKSTQAAISALNSDFGGYGEAAVQVLSRTLPIKQAKFALSKRLKRESHLISAEIIALAGLVRAEALPAFVEKHYALSSLHNRKELVKAMLGLAPNEYLLNTLEQWIGATLLKQHSGISISSEEERLCSEGLFYMAAKGNPPHLESVLDMAPRFLPPTATMNAAIRMAEPEDRNPLNWIRRAYREQPGPWHGQGQRLMQLVGPNSSQAMLEQIHWIVLNHQDPEARIAAAQALLHNGSSGNKMAFIQALSDEYFENGPFPHYSYPVRRLASVGLKNLGVRVVRRADRSYALGRGY